MNVFLALSWLEKIPDTVKAMALGRQGELHYKLKKDARRFRVGPLHLNETDLQPIVFLSISQSNSNSAEVLRYCNIQ